MQSSNDSNTTRPDGPSRIQRFIATLATLVVTLAAVGGFYFAARHMPTNQGEAAHSVATTPKPLPPQSVTLFATASNAAPTADNIIVPAGTLITLTVTADQSLDNFQIYDIGIYAHSPYPFSELTTCDTGISCTYSVTAQGMTKTYTGFLQDIGGKILTSSSDISITWLPPQ